IGAGPGPGAGKAAGLEHTAQGDDAQAFDKIVDMRVEARKMAARAGRDPAAQCRVLEALWEMTQAQRVRLQLSLERRAKHPSLDPGGAGGAVDLQHPVQVPQIEGDRRSAGGAVEPRLDAADDTAAAA